MRRGRNHVLADRGSGSTGRPLVASVLAAGLLWSLAGCAAGPDPIDTPVAWWHDLQGGVIAQDRPPPPGVDAPYPHVGTTPARPVLPSVAARDAITASLLDRRTSSERLNAHDPIVPPRPVPPPAPPMAPPAPAATQSATDGVDDTSDAALSAPPGTPSRSSATIGDATPAPAGSARPRPAPVLSPEQQEAAEPKLEMPPIPADSTVVVEGPPPQMPSRPPPPPRIDGFDIPATPPVRSASGRAAAAGPVAARSGRTAGARLDFAPASDVLLGAGRDALRAAALSRGTARIRVTGYGDAAADTPDEQAAALRLAVARAGIAAQSLAAFGVPASSIVLAAASFGRGGEVAVLH